MTSPCSHSILCRVLPATNNKPTRIKLIDLFNMESITSSRSYKYMDVQKEVEDQLKEMGFTVLSHCTLNNKAKEFIVHVLEFVSIKDSNKNIKGY